MCAFNVHEVKEDECSPLFKLVGFIILVDSWNCFLFQINDGNWPVIQWIRNGTTMDHGSDRLRKVFFPAAEILWIAYNIIFIFFFNFFFFNFSNNAGSIFQQENKSLYEATFAAVNIYSLVFVQNVYWNSKYHWIVLTSESESAEQ